MKKYIKVLFSIFSLSISLYSCEDVVDVKLDEGTPAIVVDGWITNEEKPYSVRLTKTGAYFNDQITPAVRGATVIIKDNEGTVDTLYEKEDGLYVTRISRKGKIGNQYQLHIEVEGEKFVALTEMKRVPPIDSLTFIYEDDVEDEEDGYYLLYNGPEPAGVGDYYRFRITKNDTLQNGPESIWNVASDEWVDGNYIGQLEVFGEPLKKGDKVKAEILSITKDAFYFFTELATQVNNGGMFANPPANVRTNVVNENPSSAKRAVGYFGASGVNAMEATVLKD